jgi:hypothetical protein
VGRSMPEQRPPTSGASERARSDYWMWKDRQDLAACQEKLAAQTAAAAIASNAGASVQAVNEDAGRAPATVEELETERKRCLKSEILTSAEICSAAGRQFEALMALPQDGQQCGPKSRAADLVEEDFERCAAFADMPTEVRAEDLTKEQASVIAEAIRVHRTLSEDELLRRLKEFVYTCTDVTPERPPGLRDPRKDRRDPSKRKGVDL